MSPSGPGTPPTEFLASSTAGQRPAEPAVDPEATTNLGFGRPAGDPDVTTRLGPSAQEQADRRAAFARGEAERRANAQAELERLTAERIAAERAAAERAAQRADTEQPAEQPDDQPAEEPEPRRDNPPSSPWAAPPRDRS